MELSSTMEESVPFTLPHRISQNVRSLTQSMRELKDLPRESAALLIDHFSSDDALKELRILASDLKAYKITSNDDINENYEEIKSPKSSVVLQEFNNVISSLMIKLIMVKEFSIAQRIFDILKGSLYGSARSTMLGNAACMKIQEQDYKTANDLLLESEHIEISSDRDIGLAIDANNRCVMLMKQQRYHDAYAVIKNGVVILEKYIKFPKFKNK